MGVVMEPQQHLTSWTRTLNEADAIQLVDLAQPGMPLAEWRELGHRVLPQAGPARRRELIRIVQDDLLDVAADRIAPSAWLSLFHDGSPARRLGLLHGRLAPRRPLVMKALDHLVTPALAESDRPLAPRESDLIRPEAWDRFLRTTLRPDLPDDAFIKTRSTLQGALRDLGVLDIVGHRARTTHARHGRPDPAAFAWVLGNELVTRREHHEAWAVRESIAARIFAVRPEYGAVCIDHGVTAELIARGHLMGQTRLAPGPRFTEPR